VVDGAGVVLDFVGRCGWLVGAGGLAVVVRAAGVFGAGLPDLNAGSLSIFSFNITNRKQG